MSWINATWLIFALIVIWMLYRFQRNQRNHYDVVDNFMDHSTKPPRADHRKLIVFMMALMAIWVCIDRSNDGKDVDNLVLGVLAIFVVGQVAKNATEVLGKKDK